MNPEEKYVRIIICGKVQGVGFRATARSIALDMQLSGTVCNLVDGAVEIWLVGTQMEIDSFIKRLQAETLGRVDQISMTYHLLIKEMKDFIVIY